jgi:hypothetical protein
MCWRIGLSIRIREMVLQDGLVDVMDTNDKLFRVLNNLSSLSFKVITNISFGSNYDPGRRIVGKMRGGVVGECKKEFETGIFATLETSIKLAKGTVQSPAQDFQVEQVKSPQDICLFKDVRVLLCISNLAELRGSAIPKIVNLFENAFELSFTDNLKVSCCLPPTYNRGLWR